MREYSTPALVTIPAAANLADVAYRRAAEEGSIEVAESCCATVLAQLRAAEMGVPFLPVRGNSALPSR